MAHLQCSTVEDKNKDVNKYLAEILMLKLQLEEARREIDALRRPKPTIVQVISCQRISPAVARQARVQQTSQGDEGQYTGFNRNESKPGRRKRVRRDDICYACGAPGHWKATCPTRWYTRLQQNESEPRVRNRYGQGTTCFIDIGGLNEQTYFNVCANIEIGLLCVRVMVDR